MTVPESLKTITYTWTFRVKFSLLVCHVLIPGALPSSSLWPSTGMPRVGIFPRCKQGPFMIYVMKELTKLFNALA